MSDTALARRHRVVVIGSGFGGLFATKALKRADVDVTLIVAHHAPPVPAVAVPGGDGHPVRGRDRARDPAGPAKQQNAPVLIGEVDDDRRRADGPSPPHIAAGPPSPAYDSLDRRGGRRPVLLRQRPFRRVRARHEDDRRRPRAARPHPGRVRAGRGGHRSRRAGAAPDVRRGRRRTHRCRDGRPDRRAVRSAPSPALTATSIPGTHASSCSTPRPRCSPPFDEKLRRGAAGTLEELGVEIQLSAMVSDVDDDGLMSATRTADGGSRPPARSGQPVSRPARWAGSWPSRPAPRPTVRAASW